MHRLRSPRLARLLPALVAPLLALAGAPPAHAQTPPQLRIVSATAAEHPRLDVVFALAGAPGVSPAGLTPADLSLSIDGAPIAADGLVLSRAALPLDVAVVAEVGAAMGDLASPPGRTRLQEMAAQLGELVRALPPDTAFSLTAFDAEAQVAFPLQPDGGGLLNALDQLMLQPPAEAGQPAPYALADALRLGLSTLARPDGDPRAGAPAALLLLAAGRPGLSLDPATLMAAGDNPPLITVAGMGGDQAGEFRERPGAPEALRQLAAGLGGAFFPLYTADSAAVARLGAALRGRYDEILGRRDAYRLSVTPAALDAGEHTLRLGAAGLSREERFTAAAPPVQLELRAVGGEIASTAELGVTVRGEAPIARVEYILGNIVIGSSTAGPDFALAFDRAAEPWRSAFAPGDYELFAAATGGDGRVYRSAPALVELGPPRIGAWDLLAGPPAGFMALAALALGAAALWRRRPAQVPPARDPTRRSSQESGLRGATRRRKAAGEAPCLRVAVVEGDTPRTLITSCRECLIGRDPQAEIALGSDEVSWNHAVLSVVQGGVLQLTDLGSVNGTFVGAGRTPVGESGSAALRAGDTFWVGPVRLVVEAAG
jgi:hypothetical protein